MQIINLNDYQPHEIRTDEKTIKNAENLYNNIENKLLERFDDATKAFGFELDNKINCWDFLSIYSTPSRLRNLQNFITNFKTKKVKITFTNQENNLDWLNKFEVEELKNDNSIEKNDISLNNNNNE